MRVGLIACCKQKLDYPTQAQYLYQSPMFKMSMAWIRKRCDEWAILSAKHGVVLPDQVLDPYDLKLSDLDRLEQAKWAMKVQMQLEEMWGKEAIFMVLAGHDYKRGWSMPMVEDVIEHWTQMRVDSGMKRSRARMSIGLILKALKEDRSYY
ncbi:MAG: DUF6884 domain-containing protein [bacterium]